MLPEAAHPREVVLELRELDLELALGAARVLGKDVEDQLRAVDDAGVHGVLEVALLRRSQLVVHEEGLCARLAVRVLELLELSLAHVRAPVRPGTVLDDRPDRLHASRTCKLAQLRDLRGPFGTGSEDGEKEAPLRLGSGSGVVLPVHQAIMPLETKPRREPIRCA